MRVYEDKSYEYKSEIWNFFMVYVSSVEKMEMSLTEKKL